MARKDKVIAVIFSDHHQELWKKFNEKDRRTKYASDALSRIKAITLKHKAVSIFLGDLLHKEKGISNKLLSIVLPLFSRLWSSGKFITYAISGNHDQSEQNLLSNKSSSYIKTLSKTFKGMVCMDLKQKDFGDWTLTGVPYITHDIGLVGHLKKIQLKSNKFNVLMLHTTMPGAKDTDGREMKSHMELNEFEKAIARFDMVLCGHIHKPELYKVAKTTVLQVGATQQQRLTDRDCELGYWLLYDNYDLEFVPMNKYPKFKILKPREKKPDNHNYYVIQKEIKKKPGVVNVKKFDSNLPVDKLSKNYLKEKGIKDKDKRKALINVLKEVK